MARCGCETECLCVLIDGDCTTFAGSGSVASPYQINVEIDPDVTNQIECRDDGLFIEPSVTVADTDCIDLEGDGTAADPITAEPFISADAGNILECRANGMFAPPTSLGTMCRASVEMVLPQIIPPTPGAFLAISVPVIYDTAIGLDPCGYIALLPQLHFVVPAGLDGWHLITMQDRDNGLLGQNFGVDCGGAGDVCRGRRERWHPDPSQWSRAGEFPR